MVRLGNFGLFILVLVAATAVSGQERKPFWNGLKVNYPGFFHIPRTLDEARESGKWIPLLSGSESPSQIRGQDEGECRNRIGDLVFYGTPMRESNGKLSLVTLYDSNGIIAGLQTYVPKEEIEQGNSVYRADRVRMMQQVTLNNGRQYYVVTVYMIRPSKICGSTRTRATLEKEGTGTGLYLQNGPTPDSLVKVSSRRSKAIRKGWADNLCYPQMGYHNFYQFSQPESMDCSDLRPIFLMYNEQKKLVGFGFTFLGRLSAPKWEHASKEITKMTVGSPLPRCLENQIDRVGVSTLHVYLISNPEQITCPRMTDTSFAYQQQQY